MKAALTSRSLMRRTAALYGGVAAVCCLFGAVYLHFGHGVHSNSMKLAFLIPAGGALLYGLLSLFPQMVYPKYASCYLALGIAAMTLYEILYGILEIAGAFSDALILMLILGGALLLLALILYFVADRKNKLSGNKSSSLLK